ncbi:hypothetical protein GCM10020000_54730 [Streptomyces olivoverticillatus]
MTGGGGAAVEDLAVGAQGGPYPAGGDAHLVDGVVLAEAGAGVEGCEGFGLFAQVGEDVVAGGVRLGIGRRGCGEFFDTGRAQGACEFRGRFGGAQPCLAQVGFQCVEEAGVGSGRQLDLDFGPLGGGAVAPHRCGRDGVRAGFGEQGAVFVEEVAYVPAGADADEGRQRCSAGAGADECGERARYAGGQRGADLVAHPGGDGEFEVPPGVAAAGAAAQGDARCVEAAVGGVVVDGVQLHRSPVDGGRDGRGPAEVGEPDLARTVSAFVFPLDFPHGVRHVAESSARAARRADPGRPRAGAARRTSAVAP